MSNYDPKLPLENLVTELKEHSSRGAVTSYAEDCLYLQESTAHHWDSRLKLTYFRDHIEDHCWLNILSISLAGNMRGWDYTLKTVEVLELFFGPSIPYLWVVTPRKRNEEQTHYFALPVVPGSDGDIADDVVMDFPWLSVFDVLYLKQFVGAKNNA